MYMTTSHICKSPVSPTDGSNQITKSLLVATLRRPEPSLRILLHDVRRTRLNTSQHARKVFKAVGFRGLGFRGLGFGV